MPIRSSSMLTRRRALGLVPVGAAALWTPGVLAEQLSQTAWLGEGPFYPDRLPLDTDNDLLLLNDSITPAVGEVTYLSGCVKHKDGSPVRNAFVEIWQVDSRGAYIHSGSSNAEKRDTNFQGYGRFLTDREGRYSFRTVKPVGYPGRTPHIHFGVSMNGHRVLTTQMLINGHPHNETDGVFRRLTTKPERRTVLADFEPLPNSKVGELTARFDLVLGKTAFEDDAGQMRGVARPDRETQG